MFYCPIVETCFTVNSEMFYSKVLFMTIVSVGCQYIADGVRVLNRGSRGTTGVGEYSSVASPLSPGPNPGRVVANSILDLGESSIDIKDNHIGSELHQQRIGYSLPMIRQVMTGPSLGPGTILGIDDMTTSMATPERFRGNNPTTNLAVVKGSLGNPDTNSIQGGKVYRYVSVHVPPPEPMLPSRPRPAQPAPKPETHYQIVFIKAPEASPRERQEIQLPPPPQLKTLVYVLLKKPEMNDILKISQPPNIKPSKPEVFFIRYKGEKPPQPNEFPMSTANMSTSNNVGTENDMMAVSRSHMASTTTTPLTISGMGNMETMQNSRGYGDSEIADSDFSTDNFNKNEYSFSSYPRLNINQRQMLSRLSFSPAASHYGTVS